MDIRTLAADLGLSIGTVSRALNGRPDVKAATRRRIVEAARTLGYLHAHYAKRGCYAARIVRA